MRLNILIGGKAGQGINKISEIVSHLLASLGYFTFNYRDYPSLIRGGHNFNVLCVSDSRVGSIDSKIDIIIALDDNTIVKHKNKLKKDTIILDHKKFENLGKNLNIALAGALIKVLGINQNILTEKVQNEFKNNDAVDAVKKGFESEKTKFELKKLNNKIKIMTGTNGITKGAINSGIDLYIAYPMTPATGVMHELASLEKEKNLQVFQSENEVAAINQSLGASFAGAKVMVGSSGGGYDLMCEGLSFQGMSEIPLNVYLCSRPGPGTGVPTYSLQDDLEIALRGGHGEFPRIVIAPGDPIETIESTNQSFYLSEKFNCLSIILSDKHLAESEFSSDKKENKTMPIKITREIPGKKIVKVTSYEHDKFGNTTEDSNITKISADARIEKYGKMKKECKKFEMTKTYGNPNAKNLIIGWGSTKTVILDALDSIDSSIKTKKGNYKFLQVVYVKPLSDKIKKEIEKANNVILIEQNVTGQLGRLIREKTGIKIENRILKYDGRPFYCDELREKILEVGE